MEMLEEQRREEMELAALQEEQEKQQVRGNTCVGPTIFSKFPEINLIHKGLYMVQWNKPPHEEDIDA